jgi:hypothetical protein
MEERIKQKEAKHGLKRNVRSLAPSLVRLVAIKVNVRRVKSDIQINKRPPSSDGGFLLLSSL